jgi:DNA-binding transcriptional MerR regulator
MKTNEIAEALGVSRHTIIDWSRRYAAFLSDDAAPSKGTIRFFDLRDQQILRRIKDLTRKNSHSEIYDLLTDEIEQGLYDAVVIEPSQEIALTLAEAHQIIGRYERALGEEKARADRLQDELEKASTEIVELRRKLNRLEGQLEEIRRQDDRQDHLVEDIAKLQREIGRLEAMLEFERKRNQPPDGK